MNRQCNVTKRVMTRNGLRYCSCVLSANGRIKPAWVYVTTDHGKTREEKHAEGTTSSGARTASAFACLSAKTRVMHLHSDCAKKPNSTR